MALFTAYFDASGNEKDQPAVATAGYLASAEAWILFEKDWLKRLRDDGLTYFRASEFTSHNGEFKTGWKGDEARKVDLIKDLIGIIRAHAGRQFGSTLKIADMNGVFNPTQKRKFNVSAYSLTARACAGALRSWASSQHLRSLPRGGVEHFISKTLRLEQQLNVGYISQLIARRGICVAVDKVDCTYFSL